MEQPTKDIGNDVQETRTDIPIADHSGIIKTNSALDKAQKKSGLKLILMLIIVAALAGAVVYYFLVVSPKNDKEANLPNEDVPKVQDEKTEEAAIDKVADFDQDGFPDYLEKIIGTDKNKSDTDGDGYADLAEIKNGYSPLTSEKYSIEEWEAVKGKIKGEDEGFYKREFIISETADWQVYKNDQYGFEFKYPKNVSLGIVSSQMTNWPEADLYILAEKIVDIKDMPFGFDKENILKDREAIKNNDLSTPFFGMKDFSLEPISNPGIIGKKYTILRVLEVCNVQFTREANIYKDDYFINLKWEYKNKDEIIKNNSDYFMPGRVNCNDDFKIWKEDGAETFYRDLVARKTDDISQKWFNNFETIISTFKFIDKS